jgi:hypothetical protein
MQIRAARKPGVAVVATRSTHASHPGNPARRIRRAQFRTPRPSRYALRIKWVLRVASGRGICGVTTLCIALAMPCASRLASAPVQSAARLIRNTQTGSRVSLTSSTGRLARVKLGRAIKFADDSSYRRCVFAAAEQIRFVTQQGRRA